ncbi:MAG: FecR family protein [Chthoniobacterales bacterium]
MSNSARFAVIVLVGLLSSSHLGRAATLQPGDIRVARVQGTVTIIQEGVSSDTTLSKEDEALGRSRPEIGAGGRKSPSVGYMMRQGEAIETGPNSSATLVFSNGTAIEVEQNTYFSINQFLQQPFEAGAVNLATTKTEPTTSITQMTLKKGSILGDVRKLNEGSKMEIKTPVGTAGIRGTKFTLTIDSISADGSFTGSLTVPEGSVSFTNSAGETTVIGAGQTFRIAGNIGQPVSLADPTKMTPEESKALEQAFAQFAENFSWTSPDGSTSTTTSSGSPDGADSGGGNFGGDGGVVLPTGTSGGGGGGGGGGAPVQTPPTIYGN